MDGGILSAHNSDVDEPASAVRVGSDDPDRLDDGPDEISFRLPHGIDAMANSLACLFALWAVSLSGPKRAFDVASVCASDAIYSWKTAELAGNKGQHEQLPSFLLFTVFFLSPILLLSSERVCTCLGAAV